MRLHRQEREKIEGHLSQWLGLPCAAIVPSSRSRKRAVTFTWKHRRVRNEALRTVDAGDGAGA